MRTVRLNRNASKEQMASGNGRSVAESLSRLPAQVAIALLIINDSGTQDGGGRSIVRLALLHDIQHDIQINEYHWLCLRKRCWCTSFVASISTGTRLVIASSSGAGALSQPL